MRIMLLGMKSAFASLLFLTILAGSPTWAEFRYPMQAQKVAENVYAIITPTRDFPSADNGGWNSNSAFVVTREGVLLFDTGSSTAIGRALRQAIAAVTDKPVRWIINSHEHGDHWLGNAAFSDEQPTIYASQTVAELIRHGGSRWVGMFNEMTGGLTGDSAVVTPNQTLDASTDLDLGGMRIQMMLSGGSHSPGDLMVWLPASRVLIAGDVVYSDRMPSTGAGNLKQWIKMLEDLQALQPAVVVPGHGVVTDAAGLERLHGLLTALWKAVQDGIDAGRSDYEIYPDVVEALTEYKSHFPGLEEKLRRDLSHVFLQVEAAAFQ
jgi:cyclase